MSNRLPDSFYTDKELRLLDTNLVNTRWYLSNGELIAKRVVSYKLHSAKGFTGKVILAVTDDPRELLEAINRDWDDTGVFATMGGQSKEMYHAEDVLESMQMTLAVAGYWYQTKFPLQLLAGSVYRWHSIMEEILC